MPYVPDATDASQPTADKFVESAAAEFQALKARVNALALGGGSGGTMTGAQIAAALGTGATADQLNIDATGTSVKHSLKLSRNATYSGGSPGWVNSALFVDTTVASGATSFEWGLVSRINNSAAAGENVGGYFQGNRLVPVGAPTWGAVAELCDLTNAATTASAGGQVALEIDVWCNGTDAYEKRIGIDVLAGNAQLIRNGVTGVGRGVGYYGIRVSTANQNNTNGGWKYGLAIDSADIAGVALKHTGTYGIQATGSFSVGLDLSSATNSTAAIRIKDGEYFAFDAGGSRRMRHQNGGVPGVSFEVGGTEKFIFGDDGTFAILSGRLAVVSAGNTGTTAVAGSASALPGNPSGYLFFYLDGAAKRIPYYN